MVTTLHLATGHNIYLPQKSKVIEGTRQVDDLLQQEQLGGTACTD